MVGTTRSNSQPPIMTDTGTKFISEAKYFDEFLLELRLNDCKVRIIFSAYQRMIAC